MSQLINYNPNLWQQQQRVPTLLKLLHDAIYIPEISDRIQKRDYSDLDVLLPNASKLLRDALTAAADAADDWVTKRRGPNAEKDQVSNDKYSNAMDTIMKELSKEMHSEDFSLEW